MNCPRCGFTSLEMFVQCPQCGNESTVSSRCNNCGQALDSENYLYCVKCGAINRQKISDQPTVCETHIDNQAIGYCVICGRAVCEECAEPYSNKILCGDTAHREYLLTWRVLHTFDFEYEAAMLYANLDQQGIESQVFTKLNPDLMGNPSRPTFVEVLVPAEQLEEAMKVKDMLGLGNENAEDEE